MTTPDAPRRPGGIGRRAGDRAAELIGPHSTTGDRLPPGSLDRVLPAAGRRVCTCPVCSPPRPSTWVLRDDLRVLDFAELVAAGLLDAEHLALPLGVLDRAGAR